MRTWLWLMIGCFALFPSLGGAEESYDEGIEYELVVPPQPTEDPTRIEVLELFWYGCPHCYHAEPLVENWLKRKPEDVAFRRMPAVFNNPLWGLHARAYYTAEALGIVDEIHRPLFDAIHKERRSMNDEKALADFFAEHGVDPETFHRTFHSFYVEAKVNQAREMTRRYGIDGVPSFIIDGKYRTSPRQAGSNLEVFKVIDFLIEKERKAKGR